MSTSAENQEECKNGVNLKLIIILLLALTFLACVVLGYFVFFGQEGATAKTKESTEIHKITLETFTVNLSDMEYRRYLRTDITLEFFNEKALEEIQLKKHRVRDKIITLLNQKSVSDFDSSQKIEKTRVELLDTINEIISEDNQIKALYFENFIIQ